MAMRTPAAPQSGDAAAQQRPDTLAEIIEQVPRTGPLPTTATDCPSCNKPKARSS